MLRSSYVKAGPRAELESGRWPASTAHAASGPTRPSALRSSKSQATRCAARAARRDCSTPGVAGVIAPPSLSPAGDEFLTAASFRGRSRWRPRTSERPTDARRDLYLWLPTTRTRSHGRHHHTRSPDRPLARPLGRRVGGLCRAGPRRAAGVRVLPRAVRLGPGHEVPTADDPQRQQRPDPVGDDLTTAEEPRHRANRARPQAELCVSDAEAAGYLRAGGTVSSTPVRTAGRGEKPLAARGMVEVAEGRADLVADVHGMMHSADQRAAFLERLGHLNDDGVLLMMIHNSASIVRNGMWNALKNGHFAYYSTPALVRMADEIGLVTIGAWPYALYNNGTTMLAFARRGSRWGDQPAAVTALVQQELDEGIADPARVASLGRALTEGVASIRGYLDETRRQGLVVGGYGAASRTASLLCSADVSTDDWRSSPTRRCPSTGCRCP